MEQAVIVNLRLRGTPADVELVQELGDRLRDRVTAAGVGEFDGDLIGQEEAVLYLYGPDADRLWEAIGDLVDPAAFAPGAYVVKQQGPPGGPETRIDLS